MTYYVYIVTNTWNTVLYVGVTNDISARIFEHKTKSNKGFTSKYNCSKLVYFEMFDSPADAIAREKRLKRYRRAWKEELVNQDNAAWKDLSEGWYDEKVIRSVIRR